MLSAVRLMARSLLNMQRTPRELVNLRPRIPAYRWILRGAKVSPFVAFIAQVPVFATQEVFTNCDVFRGSPNGELFGS